MMEKDGLWVLREMRCMAWLLGRPEHALTAEERGNSFP